MFEIECAVRVRNFRHRYPRRVALVPPPHTAKDAKSEGAVVALQIRNPTTRDVEGVWLTADECRRLGTALLEIAMGREPSC